MNGICLIFDAIIPSITDLANALSGFDLVQPQPKQIFVGQDEKRLWIRPDWDDQEVGSIATIRAEWPETTMPTYSRLVSIDSWDDSLIMAVVRQLAAHWTFLVNTDRGEDYTSAAFAARFDAEPGWKLGPFVPTREDHSVPVHKSWPPK